MQSIKHLLVTDYVRESVLIRAPRNSIGLERSLRNRVEGVRVFSNWHDNYLADQEHIWIDKSQLAGWDDVVSIVIDGMLARRVFPEEKKALAGLFLST